MRPDDLVAYLDGELSPDSLGEFEQGLAEDPAAMEALRKLCRQRLMIAEVLAGGLGAHRAARGRIRPQWSVAAAILIFALTVTAVWVRSREVPGKGFQILRGTVLVQGQPSAAVPAETAFAVPADGPLEVGLGGQATALFLPGSRAVIQGPRGNAAPLVELWKGTSRLRNPRGAAALRMASALGRFAVQGTEFTVEIVPDPSDSGEAGAAPVAVGVSAAQGDVQIEISGKRQVVRSGEAAVFGMNGEIVGKTVAEYLKSLEPALATDGAVSRSQPCGGEGGTEFQDLPFPHTYLIGFRYSLTPDGALASLVPLYRGQEGRMFGEKAGPEQEILARPGYVVGGVIVHATNLVHALKVIFMRPSGSRLLPIDQYQSDWIGMNLAGNAVTVGGDGLPVVGIAGRSAVLVDALWLLRAER